MYPIMIGKCIPLWQHGTTQCNFQYVCRSPFSLRKQKRLQFLFWLFIKLLYFVIISIFKELRYCSFDTSSFQVIPTAQNWLKSWIVFWLFFKYILFSYEEIDVNFYRSLNSESNIISNKLTKKKFNIFASRMT